MKLIYSLLLLLVILVIANCAKKSLRKEDVNPNLPSSEDEEPDAGEED
jgi:hypothetical protein